MSSILREKAYSYEVVTAALAGAVSLADFKAYAKITSSSEDTTLQSILDSAISFGQSYTRRTFVTTEYKTYRDEFVAEYIEVRKSPFQSISTNGFQYYNESNVLTNVPSTDYMTTASTLYSRIALNIDSAWPSDLSATRPYQLVEITFKAGYGDTSADVPDGIKNAIMAHALNVVKNRGDCSACGADNLPAVSKTLYSEFRIREIRLGY